MTRLRLSFFLAILSFAGCGNEPPSAPDPEAEAARIMALEAEWMRTLQAGDVEGAMSFLSGEPMFLIPDASPVVGREAARAVIQAMIEDEYQYSWEPSDAVVAPSGDMAYERGRSYVLQPDGTTLEGNYLVIWVREGGEWKVAVDMVN